MQTKQTFTAYRYADDRRLTVKIVASVEAATKNQAVIALLHRNVAFNFVAE